MFKPFDHAPGEYVGPPDSFATALNTLVAQRANRKKKKIAWKQQQLRKPFLSVIQKAEILNIDEKNDEIEDAKQDVMELIGKGEIVLPGAMEPKHLNFFMWNIVEEPYFAMNVAVQALDNGQIWSGVLKGVRSIVLATDKRAK